MLLHLLLLFLGFATLLIGARLLLFGAVGISYALKISPLIIGLTIVSFGTSAPEIALCSLAAYRGEGEVVLGNVLGSNIFNILFTLGLMALIRPLLVQRRIIWWDVPWVIGASLLTAFFAWFGSLKLWMGWIFLLLLVAYLMFAVRAARKENHIPSHPPKGTWPWHLTALILGIVALGFGSEWLLNGVIGLARRIGVSELFISLTVVAVGTSLPELLTSLVAFFRNQREIAVGNVIGSNLFNLFAVLGVSLLLAQDPIEIPQIAQLFDLPVFLAVAIATLPICLSGHRISRIEGGFFLGLYLLYLLLLCLLAFSAQLFSPLAAAIVFFVIPLALFTLIPLFKKRTT